MASEFGGHEGLRESMAAFVKAIADTFEAFQVRYEHSVSQLSKFVIAAPHGQKLATARATALARTNRAADVIFRRRTIGFCFSRVGRVSCGGGQVARA
jgi:hypothetical protein